MSAICLSYSNKKVFLKAVTCRSSKIMVLWKKKYRCNLFSCSCWPAVLLQNDLWCFRKTFSENTICRTPMRDCFSISALCIKVIISPQNHLLVFPKILATRYPHESHPKKGLVITSVMNTLFYCISSNYYSHLLWLCDKKKETSNTSFS